MTTVNQTLRPNGHGKRVDVANPGALLRRVAPSLPFALTLAQDDGTTLHFEFRLAFDCNAIAAAEEASGLNVLRGEIWKDLNYRALSILFWAALLAHQPEYAGPDGLEVVRSYIEPGNIVALGRAVEDAFALTLPLEDREAIRALRQTGTADPIPPAPSQDAASAGSNSGQSPVTILDSAMPNSAE